MRKVCADHAFIALEEGATAAVISALAASGSTLSSMLLQDEPNNRWTLRAHRCLIYAEMTDFWTMDDNCHVGA